MANGRLLVPSPAFTPSAFGILTVAQDASAGTDAHWRGGVTFQTVCPDAALTWDECLVVSGSGDAPPEPEPKEATGGYSLRGATPFTVYAEIDCSPVGSWGSIEADVRDALTRSEAWQVERAFWSGIAAQPGGSQPKLVYPHLAADDELYDDDVLLQSAASTPITGAAISPARALGVLEARLADCYGGVGIVHMTVEVFDQLVAAGSLSRRGNTFTTPLGNKVAVGAGYSGTTPAGASTANVHWMYATGAVAYYRSEVVAYRRAESFDRSVNTVKAIAERTYVIGWDCCHIGVPVSLVPVS